MKIGDKLRIKKGSCPNEQYKKWEGKEVTVTNYDSNYNLYEVTDGEDYVKILASDVEKYLEYQPKHVKENVNHPSHYNQGIETIDYIESHNMNFNIGNVIKYVSRAKHKDNELEDLKKARWYLDREIERLAHE